MNSHLLCNGTEMTWPSAFMLNYCFTKNIFKIRFWSFYNSMNQHEKCIGETCKKIHKIAS